MQGRSKRTALLGLRFEVIAMPQRPTTYRMIKQKPVTIFRAWEAKQTNSSKTTDRKGGDNLEALLKRARFAPSQIDPNLKMLTMLSKKYQKSAAGEFEDDDTALGKVTKILSGCKKLGKEILSSKKDYSAFVGISKTVVEAPALKAGVDGESLLALLTMLIYFLRVIQMWRNKEKS